MKLMLLPHQSCHLPEIIRWNIDFHNNFYRFECIIWISSEAKYFILCFHAFRHVCCRKKDSSSFTKSMIFEYLSSCCCFLPTHNCCIISRYVTMRHHFFASRNTEQSFDAQYVKIILSSKLLKLPLTYKLSLQVKGTPKSGFSSAN